MSADEPGPVTRECELVEGRLGREEPGRRVDEGARVDEA